ncbi:hypothetical protein M8J77_009586 [Diaphorina citri]|nr:hypothetical protein M8J77_009586 [Diaphorina citri]
MSTLDFLILTEVNVREEEAMAYQLRNFKQVMEIKAKNDGPILDVQFEQHELPNVTSSMLLRSATEKEVYNIMKNMKKTGQGSDGIRNGDVVRNAATLTPLLTFQTCQLRHQAFKRVKVNTVRYGNRRLEYCVPRLLNDFCQDFLEETNRWGRRLSSASQSALE